MSVSNTTSKAGPYNCNGAQVAFAFAFKAFSKNDLRVVLSDINGAETDLVVDSGFTVVLNPDQNASPGGTVTTVSTYATGNKITIASNVSINQLVNITNFRPDVQTNIVDKLTLICQQLAEQISRAVKTNISSTVTPDSLLASINASVLAASASATASAGSATTASGFATASSNSAADSLAAANVAIAAAAGFTLASQAEAEAGVQNTKYMSALRVAQAIAVLAPKQASKIEPFSAALSVNTLIGTLLASVFDFRPTALNSGSNNRVSTGTLTLTIPTAASLGLITLVPGRLVWLLAYNAGVPVLCVTNLAGGLQLDETNLISPTTISAGATSAGIIYSAAAVAASSPYRIVAVTDVIWTSATGYTTLSMYQGIGGQALAALSSLGYGQTWQTFTSGTRVSGTTYYNITGKPITIKMTYANSTAGNALLTIDGKLIDQIAIASASASRGTVTGIVPPGQSYSVSYTGFDTWAELR